MAHRIAVALLSLFLVADAAAATFDGDAPDAAGLLLGPVSAAQREHIAAAVRTQGFYSGTDFLLGGNACASCHPDVAAQWSRSAHRFASFNNPYYLASVEAFLKERPKEGRFCAGCHDPQLVLTGAIDDPVKLSRQSAESQAGIMCLVCHSVDHVDLKGNGTYNARLATWSPKAPLHNQRLRAPILSDPKLCGGCHKVGLGPEITGERWLRGQSDYDPWLASAVSGHGVASVYRPAGGEVKRCQDCHMPYEPAPLGDAGAKRGPDGKLRVRSHRFIAANSALPSLRGDTETVERVRKFLEGKASIDLVWVGVDEVDAVLRARGVGHRFPSGTMDSNEVWLEVEALDAGGRVIARSGGRNKDGTLPVDTHLVRAQPVDGEGHPLMTRDPQHMRGTAYNTSLAPSDPQAVRFQVPVATATVRARLLYRKFSPAYAHFACDGLPNAEARRLCVDLPDIEVAKAVAPRTAPLAELLTQPGCGGRPWDKLVDHGLALAGALSERTGEAEPILECARAAQPRRVEPLLGLARLALVQGRTDDVVRCAEDALAVAPDFPAALWLAASGQYQAYRFAGARPAAERLVTVVGGDPAALGLLARLRGVTGDPAGALVVADQLLVVDPDSEEGHYQRFLALRDLGRSADADAAQARYLFHRLAVETDLDLRRRFNESRPTAPDESVPVHTHVLR